MKPFNRKNQSGAVLVIALLFLTILTILGVTAMTASTFEEKMAGHTRDTGLAFQAADAALRDARRDINSITVGTWAERSPTVSGKTGFGDGTDVDNGSCADPGANPQFQGLCRPFPYDATKGIQPKLSEASLTSTQSVEFGTFTGAALPAGVSGTYHRKPRYIIEVMCFPQFGGSLGDQSYCNFYRITAAGFGANPNTQVTVQEIYLKP